jgi:NADH-quinone oxidoreductase subunit N
VLAVDLLWLRELEAGLRSLTGSMLLSVGCVAAFAFMYAVPAQGNYLLGMLVVDPLTNFGRAAILLLTLATAWLPHRFTRHIGEYFALLAFAALGMLFLIGSENILMLFIALELTSLSLYLLAGFATNDPRSAERH